MKSLIIAGRYPLRFPIQQKTKTNVFLLLFYLPKKSENVDIVSLIKVQKIWTFRRVLMVRMLVLVDQLRLNSDYHWALYYFDVVPKVSNFY